MVKIGQKVHRVNKVPFDYSGLRNLLEIRKKYATTNIFIDQFQLSFQLDEKVLSKSQLLVYYLLKNEIVASSSIVDIENCLENKVSTYCDISNWSKHVRSLSAVHTYVLHLLLILSKGNVYKFSSNPHCQIVCDI